jgi:hypothetical protein
MPLCREFSTCEIGGIEIGSYLIQGQAIVYIIESLLTFAFFLFVTGKLRSQQAPKAIPTGNQTGARAVNTPPVPLSQ